MEVFGGRKFAYIFLLYCIEMSKLANQAMKECSAALRETLEITITKI